MEKEFYTTMLRIRRVQEKIAEIYPQVPRKIRCPIHLYSGQEAVAAGVCANLSDSDYVFSYYRCHGHYLAKGGGMKELFAEIFGKETGCAKGRGGSMHLIDAKHGFMGTSAIVAGQIPAAVGAALAFKMSSHFAKASRGKNEKRVAVVFFGDGACEEGIWHESMNFAALKKLPVIFVCENNFYAVKSRFLARQAKDNIWQRAANYGMPGVRVDGNNVKEVFDAAKKAIAMARKGLGPTLIEARVYRWRQHCENTFFDPDILEGRPKKEVEKWMKHCPVKTFEKYLLNKKILNKSDLEKINMEIAEEIKKAVNFAEKSK
jgi:acetoin:2,6-dichlorophenolindophenol oxidoreductase subunit alpha